jgi:hypothetical protein
MASPEVRAAQRILERSGEAVYEQILDLAPYERLTTTLYAAMRRQVRTWPDHVLLELATILVTEVHRRKLL